MVVPALVCARATPPVFLWRVVPLRSALPVPVPYVFRLRVGDEPSSLHPCCPPRHPVRLVLQEAVGIGRVGVRRSDAGSQAP